MEPKPDWNFTKGNIDMNVTKSATPIPKEKINAAILDFVYEKFPSDSGLLRSSSFKMEFNCSGKEVAFIKIEIEGVGGKTLEVKLMGKDAEKFVNLVNGTLIP